MLFRKPHAKIDYSDDYEIAKGNWDKEGYDSEDEMDAGYEADGEHESYTDVEQEVPPTNAPSTPRMGKRN